MKKNTLQKFAAVAGAGTIFLAMVSPAFAIDAGVGASLNVGATTGGTTAGVNTGLSAGGKTGYDVAPGKKPIVDADARAAAKAEKVSAAQAAMNAKATAAIKKRVDNLNALSTRVGEMKHLTDAQKAALQASISGSITNLGTLQTKISGDTTTADLKTDTAAIAKDERIFMLVDPVIKITAAADRATTIAGMLTDVNTKLQARITAAQTGGADVSTATDLQTDMVLKINDAKTQAGAAITLVTALTPDGGDTAKLASNNAALKEARKDIETANQDLKAAQKDLDGILKALKAIAKPKKGEAGVKAEASESSTDR